MLIQKWHEDNSEDRAEILLEMLLAPNFKSCYISPNS